MQAAFNTDKVSLGYLPTYLKLAADIGISGRVCEVGVWRGDSLDMWQALFPAGTVVGVDISPDCRWPDGTVKVVASQDDPQLPDMLREFGPFDLIVEDASHQGVLSRRTWELLWPLTTRYYVMEDWQVAFWAGWDESMLRTAESFLTTLATPSDVADITYRHGQIILRKA